MPRCNHRRVSGPNLSQYELSTYCEVAEMPDFGMLFLSSPDIQATVKCSFSSYTITKLLLLFSPSPSWFLLWNLSW